jgi:membrane protease YdiL (CAAX protease family)
MFLNGGNMNKIIKELLRNEHLFFGVTILFTWFFWILAMFLAIKNHVYIPYNDRVIGIIVNGYINNTQIFSHILFVIGIYGPLFAYLLFKYKLNRRIKLSFKKVDKKWYGIVVLYPIILFSIALFLPLIFGEVHFEYMYPLWAVPVFLVIQLFTSATNELGFRGYLLPTIEKKYGWLKASYMVGLMWSVYSFPFIIYLNYQLGFINTIAALASFTLFMIPQSLIVTYLYNKSKNMLLTVFAHAWYNVMFFFILGLTLDTIVPNLVIIVLTWLVAYYLYKNYDIKE